MQSANAGNCHVANSFGVIVAAATATATHVSEASQQPPSKVGLLMSVLLLLLVSLLVEMYHCFSSMERVLDALNVVRCSACGFAPLREEMPGLSSRRRLGLLQVFYMIK